jgi:hypothetical protein
VLGPPERHWFIYYRVPAQCEAAVLALVLPFQQALQARHGALAASLMRRPDVDKQGLITFMEAYRCSDPSLPESVMKQCLTGPSGLAALVQGERHVEEFLPCA